MAVAIPLRLPLLEQASLTIADHLQNYPIFRWEAETCSSLDRRLLARLPADPQNLQYVTSFEMMALWVSAGYGVGIRTIAYQARPWMGSQHATTGRRPLRNRGAPA